MNIKTTRFGEFEGDEALIFNFAMPILGYNNESQFIIIDTKENATFKWLQSTTNPELAFPMTDPGLFDIDYVFELPDEAESILEVKSADDLIVLNLAKIPHNNPRKTTINLLAPIVFNISNNKAGQVILSGTGFSVEHPLFNDNEEKSKTVKATT